MEKRHVGAVLFYENLHSGLVSIAAGLAFGADFYKFSTLPICQLLGAGVMRVFFLAAFLVVVGNYFLFVSGSVFILKGLKKSDRYYYDENHMPVVSGLLYRMEQNTVRLASVAILSTCVLIILSTMVSLYSGMRVSLSRDYPQGLYFGAAGKIGGDAVYLPFPELLEDIFYKAADGVGLEVERTKAQECLVDTVAIHGKDNAVKASLEDYPIENQVKATGAYHEIVVADDSTKNAIYRA